MTKEKSCGALVLRRQHGRYQILILRHRLGGHWSFPKGHVENQETEQETALREVKEETGLDIVLLDNFRRQVTYSPRAGATKDVVYFLGYAENSQTVRQEEEISEIRWVDLKECRRFLTYNNDRSLLDYAKNYLKTMERGIK